MRTMRNLHLTFVVPVKSKVKISQILWPSQNIWTLHIVQTQCSGPEFTFISYLTVLTYSVSSFLLLFCFKMWKFWASVLEKLERYARFSLFKYLLIWKFANFSSIFICIICRCGNRRSNLASRPRRSPQPYPTSSSVNTSPIWILSDLQWRTGQHGRTGTSGRWQKTSLR